MLYRLADKIGALGYRLLSIADSLRALYRCPVCRGYQDDGRHANVEQCERWLAEKNRMGCPDPSEHHAFRQRWWAR